MASIEHRHSEETIERVFVSASHPVVGKKTYLRFRFCLRQNFSFIFVSITWPTKKILVTPESLAY